MLIPFLFDALVVAVAVMIHYEVLFQMTSIMPNLKFRHRFRIVFGVCGALVAHVLEILVFAAALQWMHHNPAWGYLEGNYNGSMVDAIYFSFTAFTTLGFGDVTPHGTLRFLVGIEAVAGLVLITWTASFLFFEMQYFWNKK